MYIGWLKLPVSKDTVVTPIRNPKYHEQLMRSLSDDGMKIIDDDICFLDMIALFCYELPADLEYKDGRIEWK